MKYVIVKSTVITSSVVDGEGPTVILVEGATVTVGGETPVGEDVPFNTVGAGVGGGKAIGGRGGRTNGGRVTSSEGGLVTSSEGGLVGVGLLGTAVADITAGAGVFETDRILLSFDADELLLFDVEVIPLPFDEDIIPLPFDDDIIPLPFDVTLLLLLFDLLVLDLLVLLFLEFEPLDLSLFASIFFGLSFFCISFLGALVGWLVVTFVGTGVSDKCLRPRRWSLPSVFPILASIVRRSSSRSSKSHREAAGLIIVF